ncbi:hypothetical protein [Paracoccus sp. S1E-3]|uniref:hypothetical protein n=1 Tax=Paracoccus sp. S1E-3 TaxID=2756130 RepID=UPI0015EFCFE5|nr:hypothetical protein [Paracoccus sp. S1E-3]MBA4490441.1 hypothetical protein [Paracoccus sp. S1E-3]
MRLALLTLLPLAACMEAAPPSPGPVPTAAAAAAQEAACRAAIARHIGQPLSAVEPRWLSETGGIATVETLDNGRRHLCSVDAAGRVLGYSHPR